MFEATKIAIVKSASRKIKWPPPAIRNCRYSTLKTGGIILIALIEHSHGVSIDQLMILTGKKRKTIRRILAVWEELGIPLYEDKDWKETYWRISKDWIIKFNKSI